MILLFLNHIFMHNDILLFPAIIVRKIIHSRAREKETVCERDPENKRLK